MNPKIEPSDLKYDYSRTATAGDNPEFAGKPDSVLFNKNEAYEVMPMLRQVMAELDRHQIDDLHRLEDLIHNDLPSHVRSRDDVFDWLVEHF